MRSSIVGLVFASVASFMLAVGCGGSDGSGTDDAEAAEEVEEVVDLTGKSVYHLEFTLDGEPFVIDRDLDANPDGPAQYFAYGSTHIAPAVSFGMTDSIQFPRTMTIGINFGIIVPSADHPIQTEGTGVHPFTDKPPSIDLFIKGLQYRSTLEGASGTVEITEWGVEEGDTVAGTFEGTVIAEGPTGRTIQVSGSFHFTLPAKNEGQPGG